MYKAPLMYKAPHMRGNSNSFKVIHNVKKGRVFTSKNASCFCSERFPDLSNTTLQ